VSVKALADAIASRFDGDAELVSRLRTLEFGLSPDTIDVPPFVNMRISQDDDLDTFDADIPSYTVLFQIKTSDIIGDDILESIDEMHRVFDDASIEHDGFHPATMMFAGLATAEMTADRAFDAEMTYELATQQRVLAPLIRNA
jgi:hypothetical protein